MSQGKGKNISMSRVANERINYPDTSVSTYTGCFHFLHFSVGEKCLHAQFFSLTDGWAAEGNESYWSTSFASICLLNYYSSFLVNALTYLKPKILSHFWTPICKYYIHIPAYSFSPKENICFYCYRDWVESIVARKHLE